MTKIIKTSLLAVSLTLITSNVLANNEIGKQTYEQTCAACHANGIAGAPKVGDLDLWADRLDSGVEPLYISAINGRGGMPAKGGQTSIPDDAIKAAVDYMVSKSQ